MSGASATLVAVAVAAIGKVAGLTGCFDGRGIGAVAPWAEVEVMSEADWGHKTGAGREIGLRVTLRDMGEAPARLRRLLGDAEAALGGIAPVRDGWRIVTLVTLRSTVAARARRQWAGTLELRARLLAE